MELSFLYHGFGIDRSYHYHATEYKDNSIILKLKSIPIKKVTCPHCGCTEVIRYGVIHRMIHNLPIGSKRTFLYLTVRDTSVRRVERFISQTYLSPAEMSVIHTDFSVMYWTC